jgi:hypothetical protein
MIADLTNPKGRMIPDGMLNRDSQAGSDFLWPEIPCLPKPYWAIFQKCIMATFCTLSPPYQPAHYSIGLNRNIGSWIQVPRNTWYPCYKEKRNLFLWQPDGNTTTILSPSKTKGFYCAIGAVQEIPSDSQPISYQQIGANVWMQCPLNQNWKQA